MTPPAATKTASAPARAGSAPARARGRQAGPARARPSRAPGKGRKSVARRVSGPARPAARGRVATTAGGQTRARSQGFAAGFYGLRPVPVLGTIGSHAFRAGRSLHDSPFVDRLLRGRIWVGLLGVLLIGLVALNVSLLRLNAQAGRNAEQAKALRIQNDRLTAKVARLASGERIESAGLGLGMVMPEPRQVRYLSIGTADGARAAKTIRSAQAGSGDQAVTALGADALSTSPATALSSPGVATDPNAGAPLAPAAESPAASAPTAPPTEGVAPAAPTPAPVTGPVVQAPAGEG